MKPKLVHAMAILSVVVCIAAAILWLRSFRRWDSATWYRGKSEYDLRCAMGVMAFQRAEISDRQDIWGLEWNSQPKPPPMDWSKVPPGILGIITDEMMFWNRYWWGEQEKFRFCGVSLFLPGRFGRMPNCWAVQAPVWLLCLLFSIPPLIPLLGQIMAWRIGGSRSISGRCAACGYDLRATPNRCPECGNVPLQDAKARLRNAKLRSAAS